MTLLDLPLDLIAVTDNRARGLDAVWAEGLGGIIAEQGLTNPITVRMTGDAYQLVTGLHRLAAVRGLGWQTIPARLSQAESDDAARLEEVMENLGRHELVALDRCQHLWELKQVWERMYPHTAHGKAPKPKKGEKTQTLRLSSDAPEIFGFAKATAEKIGLSKRSIELSVAIWTRLYPPLRRRLAGTALASKQTELKALSDLAVNTQVKVVDLILSDNQPDIGNVAQALEFIEGGVVPDDFERRFQSANRVLEKLDDVTFAHVVRAHRDRVLAALAADGGK